MSLSLNRSDLTSAHSYSLLSGSCHGRTVLLPPSVPRSTAKTCDYLFFIISIIKTRLNSFFYLRWSPAFLAFLTLFYFSLVLPLLHQKKDQLHWSVPLPPNQRGAPPAAPPSFPHEASLHLSIWPTRISPFLPENRRRGSNRKDICGPIAHLPRCIHIHLAEHARGAAASPAPANLCPSLGLATSISRGFPPSYHHHRRSS